MITDAECVTSTLGISVLFFLIDNLLEQFYIHSKIEQKVETSHVLPRCFCFNQWLLVVQSLITKWGVQAPGPVSEGGARE